MLDIRPYCTQDKEALKLVFQANTPLYFDKEEALDYVNYLQYELESYYVLVLDKQVIGAGGINYFPESQSARLSWDLLLPEHHGRGYGKALTLYRIKEVRQRRDVNQLIVRTSQLAYKFYQKMGFELEHVEVDYWAVGYDLYLLRMEV